MKYDDFIKNLEINRTDLGRGKGICCKLSIYLYPDGHGNVYSLNEQGKTKDVGTPTNNELETVDTVIDILYEMKKRLKKLVKK